MRDCYVRAKYMSRICRRQVGEGFMRIVVTSGGSAWGLSCVWGRSICFSLRALFFFSAYIIFVEKIIAQSANFQI